MFHNEELALTFTTFAAATLLIMCGLLCRKIIPFISSLHLPASILGGLIGLSLGPYALGAYIWPQWGYEEEMKRIYAISKEMPAYLMNIIFAGLIMGKPIPHYKRIWATASPHLVVGYTIAWGHYVVGVLLALLVLMPVYDVHPLNGVLIAIGFQGGYGTAAGLGATYAELGFNDGYDLALGMATAGKVSALLVGLLLINYAVKRQKMTSPDERKENAINSDVSSKEAKEKFKEDQKEQYFSADTLVIHLGVLCIAVAIGYALHEALSLFELLFIASSDDGIMKFVPLFPLAMIGGIILQLLLAKFKLQDSVNPRHLHSISHSALDILIVLAIASLSLTTIIENWQLLLILIASGLAWNLLVIILIAPHLYKSAPWTRAVGDFAHSTGAATSGLLLMKMVDPEDETGARKSFNLKQPFYEPLIGGGLITALSMPMVHALGLWPSCILFSILMVATLIIGFKILRVKKDNELLD